MRQGIRVDRDGRYHSSERSHVVPLQGPGCAQSGEWRGGGGGDCCPVCHCVCMAAQLSVRRRRRGHCRPCARAATFCYTHPGQAAARARRGKLPAGTRGIPRGALVPAGHIPAASRGGGSLRARLPQPRPAGRAGHLCWPPARGNPPARAARDPPRPGLQGVVCRPAPRDDDKDSPKGAGAGAGVPQRRRSMRSGARAAAALRAAESVERDLREERRRTSARRSAGAAARRGAVIRCLPRSRLAGGPTGGWVRLGGCNAAEPRPLVGLRR